MASTVLPNGIIIPEKFSRDWYADLYHNWQELDNLLGGGGANDGTLTIQKNGATVGTFSANQATDETINIEVPTVNNATLTIQKNGTTVDTFTANSSTDKTVDITVPTKTSDLTNDSGFITEDNTKIPLAGSNAISGDLIPSTDNSIDIGSSTKNIKMLYTKGITIDGAQFLPSNYVPRSGGAVLTGGLFQTTDNSLLALGGGNSIGTGACLYLYGLNSSTKAGEVTVVARQSNGNGFVLSLKPDGTATWGSKNVAMAEDVVPRSGGYVMTDTTIGRNISSSSLILRGGDDTYNGGSIIITGKDASSSQGCIDFYPRTPSDQRNMQLTPNGTWTWNGTAIQYTSDARLKQQIAEIDDKLLDAWEDVELSQFKYNDAVEQKGKDKARLHTGYVVQQIDKACKSHNVDVSAYGLYCHEEYLEETEEVEVEQADGTKTKETKVIREASEHYSLRYTEVYAVECMYLRRCIARLTARIEELEKGNNTK